MIGQDSNGECKYITTETKRVCAQERSGECHFTSDTQRFALLQIHLEIQGFFFFFKLKSQEGKNTAILKPQENS